MIITAKLVAIGLSLALTAFTVSTIVLAVQKADLKKDLREAQEKLDLLEAGLQTSTVAPPTSTSSNPTADPGESSSTADPGQSTPTPAPGESSSTADPEQSTSTASPGESSSTADPGQSTSTAAPGESSSTEQPGESSTTSTTTTSPDEEINYRLPSDLAPTHYDLYLFPDTETGLFSGQEKITISVNEATDKIILHSLYLNITSQSVLKSDGSSVEIKGDLIFDSVTEFLTIELSEQLTKGSTITLHLGFEGSMADKIVGLYSSSYLKADDIRKWIATSKFEPTYARQAFPCFDEPAMKASFRITLVHPVDGNYHALSNMDIDSEVNQGAFTEVTFSESVPMSTYLACFIVSDFTAKQVEINTKGIGDPFTMSVYATPEQLDKTDFALDVGKGVIEYYIEYFQIEYPLPKLDMAAIPDFVSGAMEHWGLVTYRETSLLYDVETSSTTNKQRIASVIAHEFAHMWFGNLVTMNWWNDLWLNEGFASFIEYLGVDSVFPEWQMRNQFITSTLHAVLTLDGTLGSHPIIQTVKNPDQITEIFDTITYSKGSSLVRMVEDFLGETTFRQAVTNYLNEYKYKTAETADFFAEIDKLGLGYNVTAIMETWTVQMGLPVVTIEKISDTEYKLTQKRFLANPNDYNEDHDYSEFNYRWSIPITYATSASATVQRVWFYHDQSEITVTLTSAVDWIKFNIDQVGYYRVNYDDSLWEVLANELVAKPKSFSAGDRASLLNDAFALADSTQLPYATAFDMTKYLEKETDYVPWSVAASRLTSLKRTLYYTSSYKKYKAYATELIEPIYTSLGWSTDEEHLNNLLRVTALSASCSLGLEACLTEVGLQFNSWLANPDVRPNPDVREAVYYYGMLSVGNQETWESVWDLFVNETDASEKSKLMYGLAAVQEPWLLQRYINLAWNEEYVRGQDYFTCLSYIAANPVGEPLVWEHVRENWLQLVERFGLNERYLGNLIPSITARFNTQTKLEEMEYFFEKYPEAGAGTAARVRALETVKNNIVWLQENLDSVDAWLDKQQQTKYVAGQSPFQLLAAFGIAKMFLSSYWLQVILSWAVVAFATATVVVAVQLANLEADLADVQAKIDMYESLSGRTSDLAKDRVRRDDEIDYRLPTTLEPTHYKLYWHPDIATGNFSGQETISINVLKDTNQIILHSYLLELTSVYVLNHEIDNYVLETERQFLIITMKEELTAGSTITLGLIFNGQMVNKLVGLYSSIYTTEAGDPRTIATTKFEPTYARQAFPCFDEPAKKATFQITVVHPTGSYHAVSNMPQSESIYLGENTEAVFQTSVKMSTYLACIIISDFDSKTATVKANGIGEDFSMQAYATPQQLEKLQFAIDFGVAVTEYYIQYYKVPYPLPKLDMAAIPDFASGAMEHWGLVTYRETALLYDESYSSTANKQSIAGTLAHEIAHQWFGNLVTMDWWNDLWLNEGFARFMQYKGVNAVFPAWGMLEQFQSATLQSVLVYDAKLSSHPIVQEVKTPDQITAIFDTISYDKGGSVIRMLENLVGSEIFEQAVTNYLEKHQYLNTVTDDFLSEVAALYTATDVKLLMRTWTEQMGYPVLNVTRSSDSGFTITQQRFLSNKVSYNEEFETSVFNYKWSVPLTYILDTFESGQEASSLIFAYDQDSVGVTVDSDVKWLKLNVHQMGFYRVNYEESIWNSITQDLITNINRFDIADRAHLLDDAFALADASQLSYRIPLEMTAFLGLERDFVPWYVAAEKFKTLRRSLMYDDSYVAYLNYARSVVITVYQEVGWTVDADDHLRNRLRVSIISAACSLGLPDCLTTAAQLFNNYLNNPTDANKPSPDLREIVYYFGMQQLSSESSWEQLFDLFKSETDASEKLKLMYGLSGVQDAQLIYRFLELASKDESVVRSQDYFTCVQYLANNPVGEPVVWEYYREHWPELTARFDLNNRNLGSLISQITKYFASQVKLEEVQQFFAKYPEAGAGANARLVALETIKYNIQWLEQNSGDIGEWLSGISRL
ncbi:uncharacterized protein LOC6650874 [Drosophila willistoni]|uniref:uncharacterized protein LOC6650874 n=1 Tax=Drosophila willistoni TaxID=7260 RepID=UPI001F07B017|nr:uncharacterized protein LOC6650874 [Drosophila willistoni]